MWYFTLQPEPRGCPTQRRCKTLLDQPQCQRRYFQWLRQCVSGPPGERQNINSVYFIQRVYFRKINFAIFFSSSVSNIPESRHMSTSQTSWRMFAHRMGSTRRRFHRKTCISPVVSTRPCQCNSTLPLSQESLQSCHRRWIALLIMYTRVSNWQTTSSYCIWHIKIKIAMLYINWSSVHKRVVASVGRLIECSMLNDISLRTQGAKPKE